jgi:hypothetical protein
VKALLASAILVSVACSKAPERVAVESVSGKFVAPAGWAFPVGQVVPAYGTDGMVATTDRVAGKIGAEVLLAATTARAN